MHNPTGGTLPIMSPRCATTALHYKIQSNNATTFGWNFNFLFSTPAALAAQAYCSQKGNTYKEGPANAQPGAVDGIIAGTAIHLNLQAG
jgi:hypothetical protein